ncbi:hypothetical protein V8C42DRAFT_318752 [Trichoderma barbatum]
MTTESFINGPQINDTTINNCMTNHFRGIDLGSTLVDIASNSNPESLVDDDGGSSPSSSSDNLSSYTDPKGSRMPGFIWCCRCKRNNWKKDDSNFQKHLNTHDKPRLCEAEPVCCDKRFADNKERKKHYLVSHKEFAKKIGIKDTRCVCENCKESFTRKWALTRHREKKKCVVKK